MNPPITPCALFRKPLGLSQAPGYMLQCYSLLTCYNASRPKWNSTITQAACQTATRVACHSADLRDFRQKEHSWVRVRNENEHEDELKTDWKQWKWCAHKHVHTHRNSYMARGQTLFIWTPNTRDWEFYKKWPNMSGEPHNQVCTTLGACSYFITFCFLPSRKRK